MTFFLEMLETMGSAPDAYDNRGSSWRIRGRYDEAFRDFRKAIELDPNLDHAYNNLGRLHAAHPDWGHHDLREARACAEKACALTEGKNPHHLMLLGAVLFESRNEARFFPGATWAAHGRPPVPATASAVEKGVISRPTNRPGG